MTARRDFYGTSLHLGSSWDQDRFLITSVLSGPASNLLIVWQEWQDSNLQPPVLETGALAIELHSSGRDAADIKSAP